MRINRRSFLRTSFHGLGLLAVGPALAGCSGSGGGTARGPSRLSELGALGDADANGLRLPAGFTSRIIATTDEAVGESDYFWHLNPDGGATFPTSGGGWIYVSNSEQIIPGQGGVGAVRFDRNGNIVDAYPILTGTYFNCAGGKSPWGTWFSCEEYSRGAVFECDPFGVDEAIRHDTLGHFHHEAVAFDTGRGRIYLTEDRETGGFYRFTPDTTPPESGRWDLSSGTFEVMEVVDGEEGAVRWHVVPNPQPGELEANVRDQVAEMTVFNGGEGIWYENDVVYFTTKGDDRVWALDLTDETLSIIYDAADVTDPVLRGVDNIVGSGEGEIVVVEDGDDMQVVVLGTDGIARPIVQILGHEGSEVTGPAFSPSGDRLYFSSQRGPSGDFRGVTYEVTGPFFG